MSKLQRLEYKLALYMLPHMLGTVCAFPLKWIRIFRHADAVGPAPGRLRPPHLIGPLHAQLIGPHRLDLVHGLPDAGVRLRGWCVTSTGDDPAGFPAELDALADELAGAASLHGAVVCPECGAVFDATLDPAAVLWERICADAPRLLGEVAALARAFGWSESQILALSDARRDAYLDLVGAP